MIDIIEYINHTKTTFARFVIGDRAGAMEYLQYLLDNSNEARREIRDMLKSPSSDDVELAKLFLRDMQKNAPIALRDRTDSLGVLYRKWENLIGAIENGDSKKCGAKKQKTFRELLLCDNSQKDKIISKMKFVLKDSTPHDIAHCLIALERLGVLLFGNGKRAQVYRAYINELGYNRGYNALEKGVNYYTNSNNGSQVNESEIGRYLEMFE